MDSSSSVNTHEFLRAAALGDLKLLKKLVVKLDSEGKGSGNLTKIRDPNGCTALHFAAGEGHSVICKYLIKILKFDVDLQDENGYTPLVHAIDGHHFKAGLYLVENGASMTITDNSGCTALHMAASHGGGKVFMQLFVSRGADIEAVSDGGTALSRAASVGDIEAVEFLLQNKANVDPVNTPNLPITGASLVSPECTKLLVEAGADPNTNFCGTTPLGLAAAGGNVETVKYLLKMGANPNEGHIGLTPLEMAAQHTNNMDIMKVLFPVTTRIPCIQNWSIEGVIEFVKSREAKKKWDVLSKEFVKKAKAKAAEAVEREEYYLAINWYVRAERVDRYNPTLYSNKSLCFARLNRLHGALNDAKKCVTLRPNWPKAHCREGAAWMLFKKYDEAVKSYSTALKLDPNNLEIQKSLQEAVEAKTAQITI